MLTIIGDTVLLILVLIGHMGWRHSRMRVAELERQLAACADNQPQEGSDE